MGGAQAATRIRVAPWYVAPETSSIAGSRVEGKAEKTCRIRRIGAPCADRRPLFCRFFGPAFSALLTLAPALLFAWRDPAQNRWPALALGLALVLGRGRPDRGAGGAAADGVETEFRGLPSPNGSRSGMPPGSAGRSWLWARACDPICSPCSPARSLARAMGALARIALARMVVVIDAAERAAAEAKVRGRDDE